jgi:DNA replication protein DnaC
VSDPLLPEGGLRARRITSPGCALGICDGSGFVVDEEENTARDCECRAARIAGTRSRALAGRIPQRYRGVSFERPPVPEIARVAPDQVQQVRAYVRDIERNITRGRGLWLMGDVGTGKTTLAMLVSKAAIDAGRTTAIYSLPRLLAMIRGSIETSDGIVGFLDRLSAIDLLHIDDLGAEHTTDWVLEQLYSIINARYEDERTIVMTTNLKFEELLEQIGERTVSRLVEMCGDNVIPLYGDDRRREFRAERAHDAAL